MEVISFVISSHSLYSVGVGKQLIQGAFALGGMAVVSRLSESPICITMFFMFAGWAPVQGFLLFLPVFGIRIPAACSPWLYKTIRF